ncbi:MAG: hypothetical protein GX030_00565 [Firmicutes bacterium]|nr:hypothetical protein [Bacillota bacterium]
MKLIVAVVQDQDVNRLVEELLEAGFASTKLASTGGFLKEGNTTLLIGVEEDQLDQVMDIIRQTCKARKQLITPLAAVGRSISAFIPRPVEVTVGGATIFILDVDQFEKI